MVPLHIHTATEGGGAAQVARSLHSRQRARGVEARYLAAWGTPDPRKDVYSFRARRDIDRLNVAAFRFAGLEGPVNWSRWKTMLASDFFRSADVIHLHNAHGYYLPSAILRQILQKPCVWTLHDFWLLTGRCAMPEGCTEYTRGCPSCPHMRRYPASYWDRAAKDFRLRRDLLATPSAIFAAPTDSAKSLFQSEGIAASQIHTVPNPIDVPSVLRSPDIFPAKIVAKKKLGLAHNTAVVLFAARKLSESRKGFLKALEALSQIKGRSDVVAVFVGEASENERVRILQLGLDSMVCDLISDRDEMTDYLLAADIVLAPSLSETFGLIFVEAVVAGAALVAGDIPVAREVVGSNGTSWFRLADPRDPQALAAHLADLLEKPKHPSNADRNELIRRYDPDRAADHYFELYNEARSIRLARQAAAGADSL